MAALKREQVYFFLEMVDLPGLQLSQLHETPALLGLTAPLSSSHIHTLQWKDRPEAGVTREHPVL